MTSEIGNTRVASRSSLSFAGGTGVAGEPRLRGTVCRAHLSRSPFYKRRTRDRERERVCVRACVRSEPRGEREPARGSGRDGNVRMILEASRKRGKKEGRSRFPRPNAAAAEYAFRAYARLRAVRARDGKGGRKKGHEWEKMARVLRARGVARRHNESRGEFGRLYTSDRS